MFLASPKSPSKLFPSRPSLRRISLATTLFLLAEAFGSTAHQSTPLKYFSPAVTKAKAILQPAPLPTSKSADPNWTIVEQEIITEHNRIRQNPQSYIPILEAYLATINAQGEIPNGCGQRCSLLTVEGRSAVEEAIGFLRSQPAVAPLRASAQIANVAKAHAQELRSGAVGHISADGTRPAQRISEAGIQADSTGESIDYGFTEARSIMIRLLVDDGVTSRAHRDSLFVPEWTATGVGCGPHATRRAVCVINYASISR